MKNQVIFLFLLFLVQLCPAQSSYYHPLPKSFAGWDESHRGYQTGDCKDYHHWITGDTIFAGILYHKIQTKGKLYWMGDYGCTDIVTSYFNYYSGAYRNDSIPIASTYN